MNIEKAIETLKARKKFIADINFDAHYAYDLAISALEKQLNGGWTSVKNKLPENDGYYLTTWRGYHTEPVTRFHHFSCGKFEVDGVIAWQLLPSVYKEVENE